MKIRNGFVSNSSSSSFVIQKCDLTEEQLDKIKNHSEVGESLGMEYCEWTWDIVETPTEITGNTIIDNFDMEEFMQKIGVDNTKIHWDEGHW